MRIVIISDTHGKHEELAAMSGDVLIHCGDLCDGFQINEHDLVSIDRWFGQLEFEQIIAVGGNHDFVAQRRWRERDRIFENAHYLVDESFNYQGINFYGSPWIPDLDGWAYYLSDDQRKEKCELIPENTDVLITHGPPRGILDKPRNGMSVGCTHLRQVVEERQPRIHCFGHIHASYGSTVTPNTNYYNASVVDSNFQVTNPPWVVDL